MTSGSERARGGTSAFGELGEGGSGEALKLIPMMRTAVIFCVLWFIANYMYTISLAYTSVASNTILRSDLTSQEWAGGGRGLMVLSNPKLS